MSTASGQRHHYESDSNFKKYFSEFERKYGFQGTFNGFYYPYHTPEERWAFIIIALKLQFDLQVVKTYADLYELVKEKNYFVVTMNQDIQFHRLFPDSKVSTIQGDNAYFQCRRPCHDALYDSGEIVEHLYDKIQNCRLPSQFIPRCPKCGGELEPWVRGYTFLEGKKYQEQYEKWEDLLHNNLGKKILFLELGVGRMTAGIIKYPF